MARTVDRLYGYDVFVAHRRIDGAKYAAALVESLDRKSLASFLDEREYHPGDELSQATIRNIRKATMLVVVGSPAVREDRNPDWLLREIDTYIAVRDASARRIMPISFGDSLVAPTGSSVIVDRLRDTLRIDEPPEALQLPPSDAVVAAVTQHFRKRTRDNVRLRVFQIASALLVLLSAAAVGAAWLANLNATRANSELRQALSSRLVAEGQAGVGGRSGEDEERLIQQLLAADSIAPGAVSEGGLLSAVIGRSYLQKLIPVSLGEAPILFAAFGRRLHTLDEGRLRLWDVDSGLEVPSLDDAQQGSIRSFATSPDQTQVVTSGGSFIQRRDSTSGLPVGAAMEDPMGEAGRVAYALAGRRIVSVSKESRLTLWDSSTGALIKTLSQEHGAHTKILSLRVSLDGTVAASAGDDHLICLWDVASGNLVTKVRLPSGKLTSSAIRAFAIGPRGAHVAGAVDDKVWIWDTRAATVKHLDITFNGQRFVQSLTFDPGGSKLAAAASDGRIFLWDSASGSLNGNPILAHGGFGAINVLFSPDGKRIYTSGADGGVRAWDVESRSPIGRPLEGHRDVVRRLALDHAGQRIASASDDSTLRIWTVDSGPMARRLEGHADRVTSFALSRDGTRLLSTGKDGQVLLWNASQGSLIAKLAQTGRQGTHIVAMTPDGTRAAHGTNADERQALLVWDLNSGSEIAKVSRAELGSVSALAFSHAGKVLAVGNGRGALALIGAKDGRLIFPKFEAHGQQVSALAFSPDDRTLVSASEDGTLRTWDVATGKSRYAPLVGHKSRIVSLAISPDGRRIVSGGDDKIPRIWDLRTGSLLGTLQGHRGMVDGIEFSPDGSRLLTASNAGTLHLWDANSNVPLGLPLDGHVREILSASFSPNSRYVASGSADGTVRLWDAQTGRLVGAPLIGHQGDVTAIAFSPDATMIVSAGSYGALYLWPGPRAWRPRLCQKIVRNMDRSEWPTRVSTQIPYSCQCPDLPVANSGPSSSGGGRCIEEGSSSVQKP